MKDSNGKSILVVSDTEGDPNGSGIDKIVLPDGSIILDDQLVDGKYTLDSVKDGDMYTVYDKAGNVYNYFYTQSSDTVSGAAILLDYDPNWTNQDVKVKVTIKNVDEISGIQLPDDNKITLLSEIVDKVVLDNDVIFYHTIEKEGTEGHLFIAYQKTREEANQVSAIAYVKIDKTPPTCEIAERDGKKYLTVSDTLSGVRHIVSPSGKIIPWSSSYVEVGYEVTENGTYTAYDNVNNSGTVFVSGIGGSGEDENIGETVILPTPIPPIPSIPDEETQPEGNQKLDDKVSEGNHKSDGQDLEENQKTDSKDLNENNKLDGKNTEENQKTDSKVPEENQKTDGNQKQNNLNENLETDGVWIEAIAPNGEKIEIFIPKSKIYLLESGKYLSG